MHSPQRQWQQKQLSSTDPKSAALCRCTYLWPQLDAEEGLKITLFLRFFFNQVSSLPQLIAQPHMKQVDGRGGVCWLLDVDGIWGCWVQRCPEGSYTTSAMWYFQQENASVASHAGQPLVSILSDTFGLGCAVLSFLQTAVFWRNASEGKLRAELLQNYGWHRWAPLRGPERHRAFSDGCCYGQLSVGEHRLKAGKARGMWKQPTRTGINTDIMATQVSASTKSHAIHQWMLPAAHKFWCSLRWGACSSEGREWAGRCRDSAKHSSLHLAPLPPLLWERRGGAGICCPSW